MTKKKKDKALLGLIGAGALKGALSDYPKGVIEDFTRAGVEAKFDRKPALKHLVSKKFLRKAFTGTGLGRAAGGVAVGSATFPLFYSGMKDLKSGEKDRQAKGFAKVLGSGVLYQAGKGGIEFGWKALRGKKPSTKLPSTPKVPTSVKNLALRGAAARSLIGLGAAGATAYGVSRALKRKDKGKGKSLLPATLGLGAAMGAGKGLIDDVITKRKGSWWKPKSYAKVLKTPRAWVPGVTARALGGAVGTAVLGQLLNQMMKPKKTKTAAHLRGLRWLGQAALQPIPKTPRLFLPRKAYRSSKELKTMEAKARVWLDNLATRVGRKVAPLDYAPGSEAAAMGIPTYYTGLGRLRKIPETAVRAPDHVLAIAAGTAAPAPLTSLLAAVGYPKLKHKLKMTPEAARKYLEKVGGLRQGFTPYPHQQKAIDKFLNSGQLILAHGTGTGKCMRGDTPVLTNRGILPIEALFPGPLPETEASLPLEGVHVLSVVGARIRKMPASHVFAMRLPASEATLRFRTKLGVEFEVTGEHPLPCMGSDGALAWKPAKYWTPGDQVAVPERLPTVRTPPRVPRALIELLAWQIAEGHERPEENVVTITQKDTDLLCRLTELLKELGFEGSKIRTPSNRSAYLYLCDKRYRSLLEAQGYTWGNKSATKEFPASWLALAAPSLRVLLQAFFDAEGSCHKQTVELTTASRNLAQQLQYMLLRLGCRATLRLKRACATNGKQTVREYYRLSMTGAAAHKFKEQVGFGVAYKQAALVEAVAVRHTEYHSRGLPFEPVFSGLLSWGFGYAFRSPAIQKGGKVISKENACFVATKLRHGPEFSSKQKFGGAAEKWRKRTQTAYVARKNQLLHLADNICQLAHSDLLFDKVVAIEEGQLGGYVFDLVVPEAHNFVAGAGWGLVHNTFTAVTAFEQARAKGQASRALVVVPAGLKENFAKEGIAKFTDSTYQIAGSRSEVGQPNTVHADAAVGGVPYTIVSYEMFNRDPVGLMQRTGADTLILDEFHKIRNEQAKVHKSALEAREYARNFMGLTASPINNSPAEIATLVNVATSGQYLKRRQFSSRYLRTVKKRKGFFGGMKKEKTLHRPAEVARYIRPVVDYRSSEGLKHLFPKKDVKLVDVPMGDIQKERYEYIMGQLGPIEKMILQGKVEVSDKEMAHIFSKIVHARRALNDASALGGMDKTEAIQQTPKVQRLLGDVNQHLAETPDGKAVVYSNLIKGGLDIIAHGLKQQGVPFGVFIGSGRELGGVRSTHKARNQSVEDYKAGKLKVLLVSGAGAEGLDLKNTTGFFSMDGHWNPERIRQAEARAVRLKGQEHRPPEKRKVEVRRYRTVYPQKKWYQLGKRKATVDEWVYDVAARKHTLNQQLRHVLNVKPPKGFTLHKYQHKYRSPRTGEWVYVYPKKNITT